VQEEETFNGRRKAGVRPTLQGCVEEGGVLSSGRRLSDKSGKSGWRVIHLEDFRIGDGGPSAGPSR